MSNQVLDNYLEISKQKSQSSESRKQKSQKISKIDLIYQFVVSSDIEYTPKIIAQRLAINYHTVRKYCLRLVNEGKLHRVKKGIVSFYSKPKELPLKRNDLPQPQFRDHPPLIHGLVLHYSGPTGGSGLPLGGQTKGASVYFGTHRRISKYQLYPSSATFWINTDKNPLDGEAFLFLLDFLQGWSGLPVFRGDGLERWRVCQYGLGNDIGHKLDVNRPANFVNLRLSGFGAHFLEFYDKQMPNGRPVRRIGIHHNPAEKEFLHLADFLELAANHSITKDQKAADLLIRELQDLKDTIHEFMTMVQQKGELDPANQETMFG